MSNTIIKIITVLPRLFFPWDKFLKGKRESICQSALLKEALTPPKSYLSQNEIDTKDEIMVSTMAHFVIFECPLFGQIINHYDDFTDFDETWPNDLPISSGSTIQPLHLTEFFSS